jgi:ribosome biogenesis GTPase A
MGHGVDVKTWGDVQYMNLDPKRFCISHCLAKHPLLLEKVTDRFKYLNALAYFIDKYASRDKITKAMFENYKNAFIKTGEIYTKKEGKEVIADIKSIIRYRLKWFKPFSFRYILLCDIFTLIYPASEEKAVKIIEEIQAYLRKKSRRNISALSEVLLTEKNIEKEFCLAEYHIDCWRKNKIFLHLPLKKIMVSSNMSSGKSTLINALAGKRINRSMNEACTSKLHYIYYKPYEDNYTYEYDYDLDMNADVATLMENNYKNTESFISVASYFRYCNNKDIRLCIIDSPGVNNSLDTTQDEMKKMIVSQDVNVLLYIINAEYIGTTDDFMYLQYLQKTNIAKKIWFVINKLDRFRSSEDSIDESIVKVREWLSLMGFEKPAVFPVSAYTGFLAKRKLFDDDLEETALEEYEHLLKKFKRDEYDLSMYYDIETRNLARSFVDKSGEKHEIELNLLYHSGLLCLETMLYQGERK